MRLDLLAAFVLLPITLSAAPTFAQKADLQPGARIRFRLVGASERQRATVIETTSDSIVVVRSPSEGPRRLAMSSLSSVEVGSGRSRRRGAMKGALWGAGLGVVTTAAIFAASSDDEKSVASLGALSLVAGMMGALYGAPIGLAIGSERWTRLTLPSRVGFRPTNDGMAIALSWSR